MRGLRTRAKEIRVNCVCPGLIVTPAIIAAFPDENGNFDEKYRQAILKHHPLGELGKPEDIANMALFLCSPEASFITGQIYVVDGGARLTFGKWPCATRSERRDRPEKSLSRNTKRYSGSDVL